jgi:hypothetical protein
MATPVRANDARGEVRVQQMHRRMPASTRSIQLLVQFRDDRLSGTANEHILFATCADYHPGADNSNPRRIQGEIAGKALAQLGRDQLSSNNLRARDPELERFAADTRFEWSLIEFQEFKRERERP